MEAVMTQQLPQNHQSNASVDVSARTTRLMCSFQEPLQCLRLSRVENLFSSSCNTLKQPQRDIKMQPSSMNVLAMQRWIGCDSFCVTEKEIESPPQKYYVQYLFNNTRIFNMQGFTGFVFSRDELYNAMGLMRIAAFFCAKIFKWYASTSASILCHYDSLVPIQLTISSYLNKYPYLAHFFMFSPRIIVFLARKSEKSGVCKIWQFSSKYLICY